MRNLFALVCLFCFFSMNALADSIIAIQREIRNATTAQEPIKEKPPRIEAHICSCDGSALQSRERFQRQSR